jgi:probable sporulation protein (polysaccharide deacetylase family)
VTALILSVFFALLVTDSFPVDSYVKAVKRKEFVPVLYGTDEAASIRKQVLEEAPSRFLPPIDARVDRVWKAIPGLNGREVDLEATVARTLKNKDRSRIKWVYREIEPRVRLSDLGAEPIYRGNERKKAAAIMVNVAWGTEYLPKMLEIFRREGVHATFFLDGSWLSKHPKEAEAIRAAGHEIGNHAWSHPLMSRISRDQMEREITRTNELIHRTLGSGSRWFAPPAGDFNRQVCETAWAHGMHTVLWTLDTVDWRKTSTPHMMIRKVEENIAPGTLILTHPTDRTVEALPSIIRAVKKKGITLTTVGEVLSSKRLDPIE